MGFTMRKKVIVIWLFTVVAFSYVLIDVNDTPRANAYTLYVGGVGPGNFSKIQWAIENGSSGDTIFVYSGTYYENLAINKTISLIGENVDNTIIEGNRSGDVINIYADWVDISRFSITGGGWNPNFYSLKLEDVHNCTIRNNKITNNANGIILQDSTHNIIEDNDVSDNVYQGIKLISSDDNLVKNNTFIDNRYGISIKYSNRNYLVGNNASESFTHNGIYIYCSAWNFISNNTVINNNIGIEISSYLSSYLLNVDEMLSENNTLSNNTVSHNRENGIYIYEGNQNKIIENNISDNKNGITIRYSSENQIHSNNILNNKDFGVLLDFSSRNNLSYNNILINNWGIQIQENRYEEPEFSYNNIIYKNYISNRIIGISIMSANFNEIVQNKIAYNGLYGISLIDSTNIVIVENSIHNNEVGIDHGYSYGNSIIDNNISHNQIGIYSVGGDDSEYSSFDKNTFLNNSVHIEIYSESDNDYSDTTTSEKETPWWFFLAFGFTALLILIGYLVNYVREKIKK